MTLHSNLAQYSEIAAGDQQFQLQNPKLLRVSLTHGPVEAAAGSMVAYQGDVTFENKGSGGLGKMLKKAATGEGTRLMHIEGQGEVFLADEAHQIQVMYLENDSISVNGKNVLAFSSSIQWDINRVSSGVAGMMAGGLFNMTLSGSGYVAIHTDGDPVMLDVAQAPTFGDPNAVVMWTSGVQMNVKTDTTGGLRSLARGGSGETFQLAFAGQGHVVIQPSEGPRVVTQN
jgi:uncharacterized protein (AIM24 family)